ncbi:hypothetical protein EVAR_21249_1 [Eumeta japonica]|uniref:RNA-directed DNA polymerase from mobile element jockey n=1 Tax=Eumeta variegata TaxID=151549 RepID=A0A4C1Z414_EUMVA|nr:hypothetical protein EVAR_21249_1 [Eumeta japonica]
MVPEVEDRSKPRQISSHTIRMVVESTHCRQNTPNLKMDAIIPWQRNYKYLGVTLDKNLHFRDHIERVRNTALFYKARLGAVLGRKGLRTPHYFQIYEGRIEAILRHRGITSHVRVRAAVDYQPPHPTHLIRHRPKLPYSTRPPLTASGRQEGREPTRDGFPTSSCRDDFHQASSIAHVTRRRHSHVPSGRTGELSKSSDLSSDSSRPTK